MIPSIVLTSSLSDTTVNGRLFRNEEPGVNTAALHPWGLAGIIGPIIAGRLFDIFGNYTNAFYIGSGICILALGSLLLAKRPEAQPWPAWRRSSKQRGRHDAGFFESSKKAWAGFCPCGPRCVAKLRHCRHPRRTSNDPDQTSLRSTGRDGRRASSCGSPLAPGDKQGGGADR